MVHEILYLSTYFYCFDMITYKQATETDSLIIARLHASSWKKHYRGSFDEYYLNHEVDKERIDVWRRRLREHNEKQFVLMAMHVNRACGFICTYLHHDAQWGSLVDNLHVADEYMGLGIGRKLMYKSAHWVVERAPSSSLYLWVLSSNERAIHFYEKLNGICSEKIQKEIPGGGTADLFRYSWPDPKSLC